MFHCFPPVGMPSTMARRIRHLARLYLAGMRVSIRFLALTLVMGSLLWFVRSVLLSRQTFLRMLLLC